MNSVRLTIDAGNSAIKAGLWQQGSLLAFEVMPATDIVRLKAFTAPYSVASAIFCSVRAVNTDFLEAVNSEIAPLTVLSASTPVPLANAYSTPATLGMDRLAAAVGAAAIAPGRPLLVADLGTAATYDHVSADGTFLGGNIAPGIRMRLDALAAGTAQLPQLDTPPAPFRPANTFGRSTREAMLNGAVLGVVAELAYYRALSGPETMTVITGGDARLVAPLIDFPCVTDDHLVGRGLNCISLYNEK